MHSLLQQLRTKYTPPLPDVLCNLHDAYFEKVYSSSVSSSIQPYFTNTFEQPKLQLMKGKSHGANQLRIGCVFSGGQAAGGHNVITGLFDALKKLHKENVLIGFIEGPQGIIDAKYKDLTAETIAPYRNQGGFDLIGSGRTKIETREQFIAATKTVMDLNLDGLVIIGGDDSNTNAALLAEYFLQNQVKTKVVGVPKTIDGDLRNEDIEIPFGFDSATKTYAETIGNVAIDALSAKKYTFFVKLMGRTASHITLECALATHPNFTIIGEEVANKNLTLRDITHQITDLVIERAKQGKNYGIILLPEGLLEFIPECKVLIKELNTLLSKDESLDLLSTNSKECFKTLPDAIQKQLILDRDPHGNVRVSQIDTERLFMEMVARELKKREAITEFSPIPLFCGYEGRACLPSNFDADYCYALGHVAALLLNTGATGYICSLQNLKQPVEEWKVAGIPLVSMMTLEERHGKNKPVIKKCLVDLNGANFKLFSEKRDNWRLQDAYLTPGPIQFYGPAELINSRPLTLEAGFAICKGL